MYENCNDLSKEEYGLEIIRFQQFYVAFIKTKSIDTL